MMNETKAINQSKHATDAKREKHAYARALIGFNFNLMRF